MASSSSAGAPAPPLEGPSRGRNRGGRSVILRQPCGYSVEILLYGAQVISWKNERGEENLFLGRNLPDFDPFHPTRGGIQIFFPKLLEKEKMKQRGFARRTLWSCDLRATQQEMDMPVPPVDHLFADFSLDHMHIDPIDYAYWPNKFEFHLRVILGPTGKLTMISRIKNVNTDGRSFTFPFSYQNYFSVFDMGAVRIRGLEEKDYLDYMKNKKRFTQGNAAFSFNEAVDRLYLNTPNKLITFTDDVSDRTFTIEKKVGLPNIVVWNPWDKDGDGDGDAYRDPELEYRKMMCVETAAQEREITLSPDHDWRTMQVLSAKGSNNPEEPTI